MNVWRRSKMLLSILCCAMLPSSIATIRTEGDQKLLRFLVHSSPDGQPLCFQLGLSSDDRVGHGAYIFLNNA